MFLYSLCRLGFYFFNVDYFPNVQVKGFLIMLWGGIRFDLSAILYINLLFILLHLIPLEIRFHKVYQKVLKYLFYVTNAIGLAANCADLIYYRFILKRTTSAVFGTFANEENLGSLTFQFLMDYWFVVIFWMVLITIMVGFYNRLLLRRLSYSNKWVYYVLAFGAVYISYRLVLGGIRGGFSSTTRPITLSNAGKYVQKPNEMAIVLNTPFSVFRTINKHVLGKKEYFQDDGAMKALFNPEKIPTTDKAFNPKNIVVIVLESFGKEYIGAYNQELSEENYQGFTPFLDSLIEHSTTFYSMANGSKSIDALPSILAGIPALQTPYILSHYSSNDLSSISRLLKAHDYYSAFFHGAPNGSMGFQSFVSVAGTDDYFGKDEFDNDEEYDGIWGIWDEPFFQYFSEEMNDFPQPFFSSIFSVSSHHPFKLPEVYQGKFDKGQLPIHQCIGYTDQALRKFFNSAKKADWYENTLFVLTADHVSQTQFPFYQTNLGVFQVPILFFSPDGSIPTGYHDEIAQQIDILPTILGHLNFKDPFVSFGNDLFDPSQPRFALNTIGTTYQLTMNDYLLQFDLEKTIGLYNFKIDPLLTNNLRDKEPQVQEKMEQMIKSIIQQFHQRIIDNEMTFQR